MQTRVFAAVGAILSVTAAHADQFYLIDNLTNHLYRGNLTDAAELIDVADLGDGNWLDLATCPVSGQVFAVERNLQQVMSLSTDTGQVLTTITVDRTIRNIAYDVTSDMMYGLPRSGASELFSINLLTGQTTAIGSTGLGDALQTVGFGFDEVTRRLYASTTSGNLFSIDPLTAQTSLVGNTGLAQPFDVAFNYGDGELYVTDAASDRLYRVDRFAGTSVPIGGVYSILGLGTGLAFAVPPPGAGVFMIGVLTMRWSRRSRRFASRVSPRFAAK